MLATEHEQLETLADLLEQLGNVPLERIRLPPFPGTATVDDVIRLCDGEPKRQCELVDGVLVEKVYGHPESRLAARLLQLLQNDLDEHDLGILTGADGPLQIRFIALFLGMPRNRGWIFKASLRCPMVAGRYRDLLQYPC